MIPAEIIARVLCRDPDECVFGNGWAGSSGSGFECITRAWEQKLPAAHAAVNALTAAGFRLLGPDELDKRTLETAASLIERDEFDASIRLDPKRHANLRDWIREQQASAIRSLPAEEQNNGGMG